MTKPMSSMLLYVAIFFAIVFGWYGLKKAIFGWFMAHYQPPAATVIATEAKAQEWQSYINAVGTITAVNGVDISTEVPGVVQDIQFHAGQTIHKGDVIVLLRSDLEQANLKNAEAKYTLANMNYEREKILFTKKVSSQSALDARYAELTEAQAGVEAIKAQVQQKTITAPFDGVLGIGDINLGEYVSPGKLIVSLQSLDPLRVVFNLPEQYVSQLYLNQSIDVTVDLPAPIRLQGKISGINTKVSEDTRSILVEGTIPNPSHRLLPGMYGQIKVWLSDRNRRIVVPQTALSYSLSGDYIFVLKQEGNAKHPAYRAFRQAITVGERRDNEVTIIGGLKQGDLIVAAGQLKLQNGAAVLVDQNMKM
jgi:membrane fusion protein (multidrug efflux system)